MSQSFLKEFKSLCQLCHLLKHDIKIGGGGSGRDQPKGGGGIPHPERGRGSWGPQKIEVIGVIIGVFGEWKAVYHRPPGSQKEASY